MKYYKKPKYRIDAKKISPKLEKDLTGEELYKEMLRDKRRKAKYFSR